MRKVLLALAVMALAAPALAGTITPVSSAAALGANGTIDWGLAGNAYVLVPNPYSTGVAGVPGLVVTVSQTGPYFERRDQEPGLGWPGNFSPNEKLLWTGYDEQTWAGWGPMFFGFSADVYGFGTQIMNDAWGPFTASIEAFDSSMVSMGLGVYQFPGYGSDDASKDGPAIFVGLLSDAPDIRYVRLTTWDAGSSDDFAIGNTVVNAGSPVPEPASLLLLGTGLVGAAARRYRRRS